MHKNLIYPLLLIPFLFAVLGLKGFGFAYKAAVTLSCIFIIFLYYNREMKKNYDIWLIVSAFIFSILGDWFLSNKGASFRMFTMGIGLYFLAHTGYLVFALKNGRLNRIFTSIVLLIYLAFFFLKLMPAIDAPVLLVATLSYLLISCLSLGAAINLQTASRWSYFAGIALILFSDTIISFKEFTAYERLNFLILPTYYASHIIITFALVKKSRSRVQVKEYSPEMR